MLKLPANTSRVPSAETSSASTFTGAVAPDVVLRGPARFRLTDASAAPVVAFTAARARRVTPPTVWNAPPTISRLPTRRTSFTWLFSAGVVKPATRAPVAASIRASRDAAVPLTVVNAPPM